MKRSNIKLAVAVVLALSSSKAAYAQDITQIAKSDPLISDPLLRALRYLYAPSDKDLTSTLILTELLTS